MIDCEDDSVLVGRSTLMGCYRAIADASAEGLSWSEVKRRIDTDGMVVIEMIGRPYPLRIETRADVERMEHR